MQTLEIIVNKSNLGIISPTSIIKKRGFFRRNIEGINRLIKVLAYGTIITLALASGCSHLSTPTLTIHSKPRFRMGCYSTISFGATWLGPDLGKHRYKYGWSEKNGIVYTCKAGHIDIAHVRKAADWTAYLAAKTFDNLKKNEKEFSFKFYEPSKYFVQITYPEYWNDLSLQEKEQITQDISIRLGQYLAYIGTTWHEILSWFGYKCIGIFPEFPSAFSWEDGFSNLLGAHIGTIALKDNEHSYNEAVTLALDRELKILGIQSKDTSKKASQKVKGIWYTGDALYMVHMKERNLDIGFDDGFVTPTIIPLLECEGVQPKLYPIPNLDFSEYGFSIKLEIEPREMEKSKILNIVYPEKKGRRIMPSIHFAPIMEYIKKDAIENHGYKPGITLSHISIEDIATQAEQWLNASNLLGTIIP